MKAVEFFSGLGAFAEASRHSDMEIVAAFDQNARANETYRLNFGLKPSSRNLDSIKGNDVPAADMWWMSPPCAPYTVRGNRKDLEDPRAASFVNLIKLAVEHKPRFILVENVMGFSSSMARKAFMDALGSCGYSFVEYDLCSTDFGVPMKRTRHYMIAASGLAPDRSDVPDRPSLLPLSSFLKETDNDLFVSPDVMARYGNGFDIVEPNSPGSRVICFTRNYARCMRASGSLIRVDDRVRRFSPEEILKLLGFSDAFRFPVAIDRETRWRLVGNSVDVRAIRFLLNSVRV